MGRLWQAGMENYIFVVFSDLCRRIRQLAEKTKQGVQCPAGLSADRQACCVMGGSGLAPRFNTLYF